MIRETDTFKNFFFFFAAIVFFVFPSFSKRTSSLEWPLLIEGCFVMNGSEWFRICMSLQDDIRVTCYLWLEWRTVEKKLKHFFFWVFFGEHSRFTGQQGKGEAISLTSLYHVHPLHRHLDISRAITADSSLVHIASSCTRTGNLWFQVQIATH